MSSEPGSDGDSPLAQVLAIVSEALLGFLSMGLSAAVRLLVFSGPGKQQRQLPAPRSHESSPVPPVWAPCGELGNNASLVCGRVCFSGLQPWAPAASLLLSLPRQTDKLPRRQTSRDGR